MRIDRIRVDGFGRLRDFDTGSDPLGPLVVVLGPNEAGKSTLFSFLTTALYGFQPASRERNPHVPWGEQEAGGRIVIRTRDESCVVVERKLRSAPSGTLTRGERTDDLRNRPVPWVEHVPRSVFRQVFAVTLAELAGLDEETWARIQDRVLVSMGATDLGSPREIAEALEADAGAIWRPTRRGNQRLREVRADRRVLRGTRTEALERDRRIRDLVAERESVEMRLSDVRAELHRDGVVVDRVQELLPLKRALDRVAELRAAGGARQELSGLPSDPRARLRELDEAVAELRARARRIEADLAEPEAAVSAFDDDARRLLERGTELRRVVSDLTGPGSVPARLVEAAARLEETELAVRAAASPLLRGPFDDVEGAVLAVSTELLADRIRRLDAIGDKSGDDSARRGRSLDTVVGLLAPVAVGLGAALTAWGMSGGPAVALASGAGLLAAGAATIVSRRPSGGVGTTEGLEQAEEEIAEMLRPLPLRPEFLAPPGTALVEALGRLQDALLRRRETRRAMEGLREAGLDLERRARALFLDVGVGDAEETRSAATRLGAALDAAERARDRAETSRREVARLRRDLDEVAEGVHRAERRATDLRSLVASVAPGRDEGSALALVERRIDAHAHADRLEEDLEREHPDLAALTERVRSEEAAGSSWAIDEDELVERRARIEEGRARIEELVARGRELEANVAHLRGLETVDAVDSRIGSLAEVEERLAFERDRKWVLAMLLREADRRFREEHQPDLLRRASAYLSRLTGGRYDRLVVDERGEGDLFGLLGPGLPAPVPLARPISTGTLEQAYLGLRLAIVDHLDEERETLPLFIDEALVNWDAERRDRGIEVLAEVSQGRQIFTFTCHPEMAALLESRGARILTLGR